MSTHKSTTGKFDPHYPSTNVPSALTTLPLWHSYTCMTHPGIFSCRLWGGRFVTCDMTSTLLKMICDIISTLSWSEIWMVFHMIFWPICDVLLAVQRNVDVLSQDFADMFVMFSYQQNMDVLSHDSGHIYYVQAAGQRNVDVLSQDFETHLWWCWWFLDTSVMTNQLLSETWTFCHTIFIWHFCDDQPPVQGTVSWDFWHMFSVWKTL